MPASVNLTPVTASTLTLGTPSVASLTLLFVSAGGAPKCSETLHCSDSLACSDHSITLGTP